MVLEGGRESGRLSRRAAPCLLFALLVIAVYADPLFFRRIFVGRDLLFYNLPMEKTIHDAYAAGRLPIWEPHVSGGRPLLANPNAGALYPVRALLAAVPFPLAMRVFPVVHWIMAGIGFLLLLGAIGVSRAGAWIGAVTYTFSGVVVSDVFYPHVMPGMMLLVWILWAVARRGADRRGRIVLLSVLFGLDMLAGDAFTTALAVLAALLWIALETESPRQKRALADLVLSLALGAALAAPQIVATAAWIPQTVRAISGIRLSEALFYSVSPWRLLELAIPYPFGPTWALDKSLVWGWPLFHDRFSGLFATLYAGPFALIALALVWKRKVPGARFARAAFLAGVLLSVVPSLLPQAWSGLRVSVSLRNPEKFALLFSLSLALFAGIGFDSLRRARTAPGWILGCGGAFAAVALAALLGRGAAGRVAVRAMGAHPALAPVAGEGLPAAVAVAGLLWTAAVVALAVLATGSPRATTIAVTLLTLATIVSSRAIAFSESEDRALQPEPFARKVRRLDPAGESLVLGESFFLPRSFLEAAQAPTDPAGTDFVRRRWSEHTHALWGMRTVFNEDFDSGDLSRVESLRRAAGILPGLKESGNLFGAIALRWGIRYRDQRPVSVRFRRIGGDGLQDWDENQERFADIRVPQKWREEPTSPSALQALATLAPGEVVIESGSRGAGGCDAGPVRVVTREPGRLIFDTVSPVPAWVFVVRAFWSARSVRVDGVPVETFPAQLAFTAFRIPAGRHRVEWIERAPGLRLSGWGPALFGVAAAGILFRRKRPAK
jgi:hypothetical protein